MRLKKLRVALYFLLVVFFSFQTSAQWEECNDFIGKWKFGSSEVEIKKDENKNEAPEFDFQNANYKDWKYTSSDFKNSEWHFIFERNPKADELNTLIPVEIRNKITDDDKNNKDRNTWFLEIVFTRDKGTTTHSYDACANKLKIYWYRGIILWNKTTRTLDKVINYPDVAAKLSPYTMPDKSKITDHIKELSAERKTYELPDWNSLVFGWKSDEQTNCRILTKKKINEYFMSKGVMHTFVEFFKAIKPVTKNPLGDAVFETIADKVKDAVKDAIKDQVKDIVVAKAKEWCNGKFDICRYDIKETHVFYEPGSVLEDLLLGSSISLIFFIDKYLAKAHCLIFVDNTKVKDKKDCPEVMAIAADFQELLPEKSTEGGGMKKWHILGELAKFEIKDNFPDNTPNPCDPSYNRLQLVKAAVDYAKNKSKDQRAAMLTALDKMNAAREKHDDYEYARLTIKDKEAEIRKIDIKLAQVHNVTDFEKRTLRKKRETLVTEITELKTKMQNLQVAEQDYLDKKTAYEAARKAWLTIMCKSLKYAIQSGKWDQKDKEYLRDCYYDEELKRDIPKCD